MTHAKSSGWRPVISAELVAQRASQGSRQMAWKSGQLSQNTNGI